MNRYISIHAAITLYRALKRDCPQMTRRQRLDYVMLEVAYRWYYFAEAEYAPMAATPELGIATARIRVSIINENRPLPEKDPMDDPANATLWYNEDESGLTIITYTDTEGNFDAEEIKESD